MAEQQADDMRSTLPMRIGNLLYRHAYPLYKPLYHAFKRRQDATEIALLRKTVKPGDTVLDIGSNIGFYSALLSDLVGPSGKVYCFEPDRNNFKHLLHTISGRSNVIVHQAAVSDQSGTLTLYTSHRLNVDHRTYEPAAYDDSYTVPAIRIDDLLPAPATVNFIKMDIQGAEYLALKGMLELLQRSQNVQLLFELAPAFLRKCSGVGETEIAALLQSAGLQASVLTERGLQPDIWKGYAAAGTVTDSYYNLFATKVRAS